MALERTGVATVGGLEADGLVELAPKLWVVPPGGSLLPCRPPSPHAPPQRAESPPTPNSEVGKVGYGPRTDPRHPDDVGLSIRGASATGPTTGTRTRAINPLAAAGAGDQRIRHASRVVPHRDVPQPGSSRTSTPGARSLTRENTRSCLRPHDRHRDFDVHELRERPGAHRAVDRREPGGTRVGANERERIARRHALRMGHRPEQHRAAAGPPSAARRSNAGAASRRAASRPRVSAAAGRRQSPAGAIAVTLAASPASASSSATQPPSTVAGDARLLEPRPQKRGDRPGSRARVSRLAVRDRLAVAEPGQVDRG